MSLTPAKMKFVDMVILERDARRATTALGRLGVLELVKVKPEETAGQAALPDRSGELQQCRALISRLDAVREKVGLAKLPECEQVSYEPLAAVEQEIARLEGRVNALLEQRAKIESESEQVQDELARFDVLGAITVPMSQILESPFLHFVSGSIKTTDLGRLTAQPNEGFILLSGPTDGDRHNLVAITSRKGRDDLEAQLKRHNFLKEDISRLAQGTPATVLDGMNKRLDEIRSEQEHISQELKGIAGSEAQKIASLDGRLKLELALVEASLNFGRTSSTCRISGWLPADQVAPASARMLQETGGRLFVQVREPGETDVPRDEVPILLKNGAWIRHFELLVTGFGFPRYGEIQPTVLMALSFMLMYGLMFGDVGQGAVLVIIGLVMRKRCATQATRDLGMIIAFAGAAATVFGFLYGSVFGNTNILHPLMFEPLDNVVAILAIPVVLGILMISLGMWVNMINKFRNGDFFNAIISRTGVAGLVLYWGAIGLGLYSVLNGIPSHMLLWVVLLIVLPLALLLLKEVLHERFVHQGHEHESEGAVVLLMSGGVDVMETLTGFLANTVSFARVGAFALAHAALCMAIYKVVGVASEWPGAIVWSALVIVVGNAIIVLLEGMVVFVQGLRLEYYEFFSKFYEGAGKRYQPFRIG